MLCFLAGSVNFRTFRERKWLGRADGILLSRRRQCAERYWLPIGQNATLMMTNRKINNSALLLMFLLLLFSNLLSAQEISKLRPGNDRAIKSEIMINNKSGGPITQSELLESSGLKLTSAADSLFQISSFRLTRIKQGEDPVEESNKSNGELTDAMKSIIKNTKKGDKIYFEYIKCKGIDGTIRSMPALSFIIE
jgi:hypothetical protein